MNDHLLIKGLEHEKASPDFARLRDAILREGRSDRLPFLELFADIEIKEAILGRPAETMEDKVEFFYRLGYDCVSTGIPLYFPSPRTAAANTSDQAYGDRHWVTDNTCPIQTREDFDCYKWPDPEIVTTEHIENTAKILPDGMGMLVQSSGILENVMWLMGYAGLSNALYDDPSLVQDMFDEVGKRVYRALEKVVDCREIGGVFFGEDMGFKTATMIAPEHFRKYHFPHLRRVVELAHKHGKFFILHSCGNLEAIMDDLIDDVGIDARHSYEDAIMPVAEFKQRYGHRLSVVGGIDVDVLTRADVDTVRAYVRNVIEKCVPDGGYTLGTGNSVTNYIKVENYLVMLEEGWRYREGR